MVIILSLLLKGQLCGEGTRYRQASEGGGQKKASKFTNSGTHDCNLHAREQKCPFYFLKQLTSYQSFPWFRVPLFVNANPTGGSGGCQAREIFLKLKNPK
jgi:hypothetical protein